MSNTHGVRRARVVRRAACVGALATALLVGVTGVARSSEPITLRLGHVAIEGSETARAADRFADSLAAVSGGRMSVRILARGKLGGMTQHWAQLRAGALDLFVTDVGAVAMNKEARSMMVLAVPFLFRDQAHFDLVARSPFFLKEMARIDQAAGFHFVGVVGERSPRIISTTRRAVRSVKDLEGLRMRVPPSPIFTKAYEAWGAVPTPVPARDLLMALRSGMVDGQSNGIGTIYRPDLHPNGNPPLRHVTPLNWVHMGLAVWMSASRWAGLGEVERDWVRRAAEQARADGAIEAKAQMARALAGLAAYGMTLTEPDRESFLYAKQVVVDAFEGRAWPKGWVAKISAMR
ncbi:MAG: TRAP transporter substrate-binding protein [Burkholderiaceae bacterium]